MVLTLSSLGSGGSFSSRFGSSLSRLGLFGVVTFLLLLSLLLLATESSENAGALAGLGAALGLVVLVLLSRSSLFLGLLLSLSGLLSGLLNGLNDSRLGYTILDYDDGLFLNNPNLLSFSSSAL